MTNSTDLQKHKQLLNRYFVPEMGMYTDADGEVTVIVSRLDRGEHVSEAECTFLSDKGLHGLSAYARHHAQTGIRNRHLLRTAEDRRREAAYERRELWKKFGIEYVEREHIARMLTILRRANTADRLTDDDCLWLTTLNHFSAELRQTFHRNEARHYQECFIQHGNPRDAVNANSHYRKAGQPQDGLTLLNGLNIDKQSDTRLASALFTTKGGSLRDLHRHEDAMDCAQRAHEHEPRSFHPCTLLGALHYEAGNRVEGDLWFAKGIERGAAPDVVDGELRAIWRRSNPMNREAMRQHLLELDPERYAWIDCPSPRSASHRGKRQP